MTAPQIVAKNRLDCRGMVKHIVGLRKGSGSNGAPNDLNGTKVANGALPVRKPDV